MAAMPAGARREQGDRVLIYMPMIAEAAFAMLACARIGAIHSVVFGGFASGSLATRIDDAQPVVIVSADAGSRAGKVIAVQAAARRGDPRWRDAQAGARSCWSIAGSRRWTATPGRDVDYAALRERHLDADVPCAWLESTTPSYTLYTSGTTGKPKGVQRDTGGYAVALAASMKHIFCGQPGETYFSTSDIGWVVGHSYIVYGPLIAGMATIMYEGLPIRPDAGIWWSWSRSTRSRVMFSRADRDARAEEAGPGVPDAIRPVARCARCSSPANRSTSRPRAGSPRRWASRSSTTTGRPKPAGRS